MFEGALELKGNRYKLHRGHRPEWNPIELNVTLWEGFLNPRKNQRRLLQLLLLSRLQTSGLLDIR